MILIYYYLNGNSNNPKICVTIFNYKISKNIKKAQITYTFNINETKYNITNLFLFIPSYSTVIYFSKLITLLKQKKNAWKCFSNSVVLLSSLLIAKSIRTQLFFFFLSNIYPFNMTGIHLLNKLKIFYEKYFLNRCEP